MSCMIVGHSFVRRLRRDYGPTRCRSRWHDVLDEEDALTFSSNLKCREVLSCGVYTYSYINLISDLRATFRPTVDLLVIDIGSNDIASARRASQSVMQLLAEYVFQWGMRSYAKHIIFLGVLPRTHRLQCSVDQFNLNRRWYHEALKQLCAGSNRASMHHIRGFENIDNNIALPVINWSHDGIHPITMDKYCRRLRMLMMRAYRATISRVDVM